MADENVEETKSVVKDDMEVCCFNIEGASCGIPINLVQEINKKMEMTSVPLAEDYILGIMNLRGQIVTIMDLGKRLGLGSTEIDEDKRIIILKWEGEFIGLLVGDVSDIIEVNSDEVSPPPSNIKGMQGKYFTGVYKGDRGIVAILDVESVLKSDN